MKGAVVHSFDQPLVIEELPTPEPASELWVDVCDRYPVLFLEDGMAEADWERVEAAHRPDR
jgi:enolase